MQYTCHQQDWKFKGVHLQLSIIITCKAKEWLSIQIYVGFSGGMKNPIENLMDCFNFDLLIFRLNFQWLVNENTN